MLDDGYVVELNQLLLIINVIAFGNDGNDNWNSNDIDMMIKIIIAKIISAWEITHNMI